MNIYWDSIILGFLILAPLMALFVVRKLKLRFPASLSSLFLLLVLLAWGIIYYGSFIEPQKIVVRKQTIQISSDEGRLFTALVISDLHLGLYKKDAYLQRVIDQITQLNPDYIFLLGDYVYRGEKGIESFPLLDQLASHVPVYAVMGNHDYDLLSPESETDQELGDKVKVALEKVGIKVLVNEGAPLSEDPVFLAGIDDLWTYRDDVSKSLEENNDLPIILLSHNPDIISKLSDEVDLTIAGHTHGGQIRLPILGAIGKIPTKLGQKIDQGLFDQKSQLYITSGIGESGPRARLFNPPEMVLLTILY